VEADADPLGAEVSYSEKDGQVVLTMSREDWEELDAALKLTQILEESFLDKSEIRPVVCALRERLNQGNPHYTPYRIGEKG